MNSCKKPSHTLKKVQFNFSTVLMVFKFPCRVLLFDNAVCVVVAAIVSFYNNKRNKEEYDLKDQNIVKN